jgi:4-amino-4-deoxy-L-arabinose transferase-like glycosyltransferase
MMWLRDLSYFFGGVFLANAIPHFVSGVMGRPFQSPFAKPPGEGLSSSTVNVLWGCFNLVIGYLLIGRVGEFDARSTDHVLALGLGVLLMALITARLFGRFHGGNAPDESRPIR